MTEVRHAAENDPRIHILTNPENSGAGFSRNNGIEYAHGEYLAFIDPDDYINKEYFESLYQNAQAQDLDIVKGSRVIQLEDGTIKHQEVDLNSRITDGLEEGKPLYILFTSEHTTGIYRKSMIIGHNVRYGTSRKSQDVTFLLGACLAAETFGFADNALYYYCKREGSTVHRADEAILKEVLKSVDEQMSILVEKCPEDNFAPDFVIGKTRSYLSFHSYIASHSRNTDL